MAAETSLGSTSPRFSGAIGRNCEGLFCENASTGEKPRQSPQTKTIARRRLSEVVITKSYTLIGPEAAKDTCFSQEEGGIKGPGPAGRHLFNRSPFDSMSAARSDCMLEPIVG